MTKKFFQKEEAGARVMTLLDMILVLAGLIYVIVVTVKGYNDRIWYKLLVVLLMMGYTFMFNTTALAAVKAYESMTKSQRRNYNIYMLFDALAVAFLALFVVNADRIDEPFHYVALGMFLILSIPRSVLYHNATDEPKRVWRRKISRIRDRKRAKAKEIARAKERESHFVQMDMSEYSGAHSVDDTKA